VYLCLVFGISALIAFLSATRVWFGIFLFITAGVFLKKIKYLSKMLVPVLLILVILFSLMKSAILTKDYLTHSTWGRVSQIFDLGSGKCENIDTLASRLDDVPTLLNAIRSNPFFGYGFSDISYKCYDSDIGFLNTIMMFGIIGFCFFVYLYISYFKMMFSALNKPNSSKEFPLVLLTTFCAMLIAYFLTWDFFSLYHAAKVSFLMVFFGLSEISAKEN
jgi:O-antigen ligase